jgi:leucyl-tRNA synthetase
MRWRNQKPASAASNGRTTGYTLVFISFLFEMHSFYVYSTHVLIGYLHQRAENTKMSKSLKNTISIKALLKAYTPAQFRLFCMMTQYRNRK